MKAYAIVIKGNKLSEAAFETLTDSSKSVGNKFPIQDRKSVV